MTTDLTRDRILELKAGRQLDALVAIHIFGRDDVEIDYRDQSISVLGTKPFPAHYSTEIQDALKVVEKMNEGGEVLRIQNRYNGAPGWWVIISGPASPMASHCIDAIVVGQPTLPLAACHAALLAKLR